MFARKISSLDAGQEVYLFVMCIQVAANWMIEHQKKLNLAIVLFTSFVKMREYHNLYWMN